MLYYNGKVALLLYTAEKATHEEVSVLYQMGLILLEVCSPIENDFAI